MVATDHMATHFTAPLYEDRTLHGLVVGVSTVGRGGLGPTLFWRRPSVASLGCCGMCGVWCTILVGWCATLQFGGRLLIYMKNYISEFKSAACRT